MENRVTENTCVRFSHRKRVQNLLLPDAPKQAKYFSRDVAKMEKGIENQRKTTAGKCREESGSPLYTMVMVKREIQEPGTNLDTENNRNEEQKDVGVKLEPEDVEMEDRYDEMQIGEDLLARLVAPDGTATDSMGAVKEEPAVELPDSEIKFETVDLSDIYLNDNFQQIWEPPAMFQEKAVQVSLLPFHKPKFIDVVRSDKDLRILTGIPSFSVLNTIVDIVKIAAPRFNEARGLRCSVSERVIMTFMKLKENLSFAVLAIVFQCSSRKSCKKIVFRMLDILSSALKFAIPWPSKDEALRKLPDSFDVSPDIRCILNIVKINTRRPKKICHRIETLSRHTRNHNIKFIIGLTPSGLVSFVSKSYGARTPLKVIFEQSNLRDLLKQNDVLFTLKPFPIEDTCEEKGVKLVNSSFGQFKSQFPNLEPPLNTNRRVRRFRILQRKLTNSLALKSEQIMTVICAVVNLSSPIFETVKLTS